MPRLLLHIIITLLAIAPASAWATGDADTTKVYSASDDPSSPSFPGGDAALLQYIQDHIQFPGTGVETQGTVVVRALIKADGQVGDVRVERSIHPDLDAEAVRVVKSLPRFNPAFVGGKHPIDAWLTIPIKFQMLLADAPTSDSADYKLATMPQFPGGPQAMVQFLSTHLNYPAQAVRSGVQGTVLLTLQVLPDGSVGQVTVRQSLSPECDREAIRVVRLMPRFIPGTRDGLPAAFYITLPINFSAGA